MAGINIEICGFLDAKLPGSRYMTQRVKKRSLAPWKVWRRHWCTIKKLGPGLGIEVQMDYGIGSRSGLNEKDNSIQIPIDALIYRTESKSKSFAFGIFLLREKKPILYLSGNSETETQRWMANIRQLLKPRKHRFIDGSYNISIIDSAHSRLAALIGLHGDLITSQIGVFIKDANSGEIVANFEWKELDSFHLATAGRPEDVKRICVIHTTKEFRSGIGEIYIFCLNADKLLQDLVTQGRGPKHRHIPRPLSLSEGDLRISIHRDETTGNFPTFKNKIACSLINAGLGLLLSSRTGSETKLINEIMETSIVQKIRSPKITNHSRAVDNVYESEPATNTNNFELTFEEFKNPHPKRISNISVGSGIYEEISDTVDPSKTITSSVNLYEDPEQLILHSHNLNFPPPPLPPRQRCETGSAKNDCDDGLDSEGGTRSASPNTQDDISPPIENKILSTNPLLLDTSEYVPMSPRFRQIALHQYEEKKSLQEGVYMPMR